MSEDFYLIIKDGENGIVIDWAQQPNIKRLGENLVFKIEKSDRNVHNLYNLFGYLWRSLLTSAKNESKGLYTGESISYDKEVDKHE